MRADVTESKLGTEIDFMVFASHVEVTHGGTYLGCQQFGAPASLPRLAKYQWVLYARVIGSREVTRYCWQQPAASLKRDRNGYLPFTICTTMPSFK